MQGMLMRALSLLEYNLLVSYTDELVKLHSSATPGFQAFLSSSFPNFRLFFGGWLLT